jgi:hypothetical protein
MKWKVVTQNDHYIVESNSSKDAVAIVVDKHKDKSTIKSVTIEPKNIIGKTRRLWRNTFGK